MADYHAVLLRTLEGLGQTTPELRQKLYERARATIGHQLDSANPPMSADAVATQKAHLEAAIASIESEYQPVAPSPGSAASGQPAPQSQPSAQVPQTPPPAAQPPAAQPPAAPVDRARAPAAPLPPAMSGMSDEPVYIPSVEEEIYEDNGGMVPPAKSGRKSTIIVALVGLIIIGGGVAALWANRTSLSEAFTQMTSSDKAGSGSGETQPGDNTTANSQVNNNDGLVASTTVEPAAVEKFDQRLNANGEEVAASPLPENTDTLPAGLEPSPVTTTRIVVPEAVVPEQPQVSQATPAPENADAPTNSVPTNTAATPALVAQKGFLYEEGSVRGQNSVDVGSVVWSVVQESPGEGQPLEPAIRAKVEIGSRGLTLLVTIKRNTDKALPASHLIELIFSVPDDFAGGSIDKVQRFVFKESEEARGEALVGVPATIADGIFLIALNNLPQAVERNTQLMKGREWIDIPLGYRTGRRALITLEKGVPGERVFNEVFAAWDKAG